VLTASAAPRLRDAALDEQQWSEAYVEMLVAMRRMFQTCKLVHADLSEYNVL
jgi:RIO kinase 1